MNAAAEDKVADDASGLVHYIHRRWSEHADALCGLRVWYRVRLHSGIQDGDAMGMYLGSDSKQDVTCMECIILQVPR